jgi:hypothetical protein
MYFFVILKYMSNKIKPEVYEEILVEIRKGKSLNGICKKDKFPSNATVHNYMNANPDYREKYAAAKLVGCDVWADEILEISDETPDIRDSYAMAQMKARIDARKWTLSKLVPKKYGDKLDLNHGGQENNPIKTIERVIIDNVTSEEDVPDFN